ncbi:unnamed protein product [Acanthoscelides obtectus]|uniref:Tetraspanin n=1 Tax=Acanthoscelides obtectus TaxID=200917 RepID=A0A9P0MI98_ACAOB|nr:unnamed protein product [Acanthoscelides obtectus]CAK1675375.1 CD63 antigen [Acanthoscelides obtectus]
MYKCSKIALVRTLAGMQILIVCVSVGMIAFVAANLRHRSLRTDYSMLVTLMIINGIILISLAAVGIVVSIYEWANVARCYAFTVIVTALIQASIAIFAVTQLKEIASTRKDLERVYEDYPLNKKARTAIDGIQKDVECCGVDGPQDWQIREWKVPDSCKDIDGNVFKVGCLVPFHNSIVVATEAGKFR